MKNLISAFALLLALPALAETKSFNIKGMHCSDCASAVESHVCKMPDVKTCKAEVLDEKAEMGKVTITTEEGKKIDDKKVAKAVSAAGKTYHVVPDSKKN